MRQETRKGDESVRDDDYVKPKEISYEANHFQDEHSDKSSCNAFSLREERAEGKNIDNRYFVDLRHEATTVPRGYQNVIEDDGLNEDDDSSALPHSTDKKNTINRYSAIDHPQLREPGYQNNFGFGSRPKQSDSYPDINQV